jgi:hypothetical protein
MHLTRKEITIAGRLPPSGNCKGGSSLLTIESVTITKPSRASNLNRGH